jgi:hypothetical protein
MRAYGNVEAQIHIFINEWSVSRHDVFTLPSYSISLYSLLAELCGNQVRSGHWWSDTNVMKTLSLTSALDEDGAWRHASAILPPRMTLYPLYWRLLGLQGRSGRVRKILPPPGFNPRTVQPVASISLVLAVNRTPSPRQPVYLWRNWLTSINIYIYIYVDR